jgi:putative transport protein
MARAKPDLASAWRKFELRAYRLAEDSPLAGLTVAAAEARVPEHRLFIHRLRRGERILEAEPEMTLKVGDMIALSGRAKSSSMSSDGASRRSKTRIFSTSRSRPPMSS